MSGDRWPAWVHRALEPGPEEVARLGVPAAALAWCAQATEPLDEEMQHLRPARLVQPARPWPWLAAGGALLVVATGAVLLSLSQPPPAVEVAPVEAPVGVYLRLEAGESQLVVPAVRMDGLGQVEIHRADDDGAVVAVHEGAVHFGVGEARLELRIGSLRLSARDADLQVTVVHEAVLLRVDRGEVRVQAGPHSWTVAAPDTWSWPEAMVVLVDALEPTVTEADLEVPAVAALAPPPATTIITDGVLPAVEVTAPVHSAKFDFAAIMDTVEGGTDDAEQLALLDAFLERHAGDPLAEEAEVRRLAILARGEFPFSAWQETQAWLVLNPGSPRHVDMLWMSAELARNELRDCRRALPLYRELETAAAPWDQGRAHALSGLCALDVGEVEEGRLALDEALASDDLEPSLRATVQGTLERLEVAP